MMTLGEFNFSIAEALSSADLYFDLPGDLEPVALSAGDVYVDRDGRRICIRIIRPLAAALMENQGAADLATLSEWARLTQRRVAALETAGTNPDAVDYGQLAEALDYDRVARALAEALDYDRVARALAEALDHDRVARACVGYIDAGEIARHVDPSDIAEHIDASDIAEHIDASDIAEELDLTHEVREALRNARFRLE